MLLNHVQEIQRAYPLRVALRTNYRMDDKETRERLAAYAFFAGVRIGQHRWITDELTAAADAAGTPHDGATYYLEAWTLPVHAPAPWWQFGPQPFNWVAQPDLAMSYRESLMSDLDARFHALVESWREGTMFLSSPTDIARHEAYQRIIGMGPDVVPLILGELRDNGGDWYIALRALVSDPPTITPAIARSTRNVIETWLEWGRHHHYRF